MKKNGKDIECKYCKKLFYISGSRIGIRKYCSKDCLFKDNFGFKNKERSCVICGNKFIIDSYLKINKKTCSDNCHYKLATQITKKSIERRKNTIIINKCKNCSKEFETNLAYKKTYCSNDCQYKFLSTNRTGKKNPNYKDGHATKAKFGGKRNIYTTKHFTACNKYRKDFLKKHDYLFCEECGVNVNGTSHFEVHHLYFASRWPRHKELHNFKNLILLCKQCHGNYHNGTIGKKLLNKREIERGLKDLFKRNYVKANTKIQI